MLKVQDKEFYTLVRIESNGKDRDWNRVMSHRKDLTNLVYRVKETPHKRLAVDLENVPTVFSADLEALIKILKTASNEEVELSLLNASDFVKEILQDTNLTMILSLYPNVETYESAKNSYANKII